MVWLVAYGVSASPGMAGTTGNDPVATMKRRAAMVTSPATTVCRSVKRA